MRKLPLVALTLLTALLPVTTLAIPPSVTGLKGTYAAGKIAVSWSASQDAQTAYYRVYWSRNSILQNDGRWEDFEATPGKDTSYTLLSVPASPSIYIGVMAVNTFGEESPVFTEEVKVDTGTAASSSSVSSVMSASSASSMSSKSSMASSAASSSKPNAAITTLDLVTATPISATGVLLTFSLPVKIAAADGSRAFMIMDASGTILQISRITTKGTTVILKTLPQLRDQTYTITVSSVVMPVKASDPLMNPQHNHLSFKGHPDGLTTEAAAGLQTPTFTQDVANLNLHGEQKEDGTYTVTTTWIPREKPDTIVAYQVRQTRDGGQTWSEAQTVGPEITSIRVAGVPAGTFAVMIRVVAKNGIASRGTYGSIDLPVFDASGSVSSEPVTGGTVTPVGPGRPPKTPQSGPGELLMLILAGAAMGTYETRRRARAEAIA